MATIGASEAIFLAIAALIEPGDEAIVIGPAFFLYEGGVRFFGGRPKQFPLQIRDGRYLLDTDKLGQAITDRTKLVVLNSPHNPTGWVADRETVKRLAEMCDRLGVRLLSDEVYSKYDYSGSFVSPEEFSGTVIAVDGVSKSYRAPGFRIGWLVAEPGLVERILPLHQLLVFSAPTPLQCAVAESLAADNAAMFQTQREAYRKRRDLISQAVTAAGLSAVRPDGAFYIFPKLPDGMTGTDFAERLFESKHLAVVPGADYGQDWDRHFRVCFSQTEETLAEAGRRLAAFVRGAGGDA